MTPRMKIRPAGVGRVHPLVGEGVLVTRAGLPSLLAGPGIRRMSGWPARQQAGSHRSQFVVIPRCLVSDNCKPSPWTTWVQDSSQRDSDAGADRSGRETRRPFQTYGVLMGAPHRAVFAHSLVYIRVTANFGVPCIGKSFLADQAQGESMDSWLRNRDIFVIAIAVCRGLRSGPNE